MDAQHQIAALRLRVSSAEAALDRARAEATTAWRALADEEDARVEERKVQRAATVVAMEAAEAVYRRQLHASRMRELDTVIAHDVELRELRRGHAEELAAAVAAAKEAERERLRATVGPVLQGLQDREQQYLRRTAVVDEELRDTRDLLWETLEEPAATRRRLGF